MKTLITNLLLLSIFFIVGILGFIVTTTNVIFETIESAVNNISQYIEEKLEKLEKLKK